MSDLERIERKIEEMALRSVKPAILTIKDVAGEYKLSPHVQREARRSVDYPLEYIVTGKDILYRREAVEAYLDSLTVKSII